MDLQSWKGVSEPLGSAVVRVLSLGAGVQSTTLALMSARGDLPLVDFAVFADTGWEPRKVYRHLDWLETQLPFPVYRVRREGPDLGELSISVAAGDRDQAGAQLIPFFSNGGLSPKQCSKEFKTRPVARFVLKNLVVPPVRRAAPVVEMWLGMSTDELQRLKKNERPWIRNRYPLVEARMDRNSCSTWLADRQVKCPRSACIFCGYHSKNEWRGLMNDPEERSRIIAFDRAIRTLVPSGAYLTRDEKPIEDIDFSYYDNEPDLFANECEGICNS